MSYNNIQPKGNRVLLLIEPGPKQLKTAGGIILPETKQEQEKCVKGKVVAVGEGEKEKGVVHPITSVKVGDIVLYSKWSGSELQYKEEDLVLVKEPDILAVMV